MQPGTDGDAIVLRRARDADVDSMRALARAAYQVYVKRIGREPAPMTADYAGAVESGRAWVAERQGHLVGLLVVNPEADHLLLENVAVAPEAQRLGIGRALLRLAEEQARANLVREVRLYTHEMMTENIAYYGRHGYRETHRVLQDGFHRVFFRKTLDE